MQNKTLRLFSVGLIALLLTTFFFIPAHAQDDEKQPVVRAVLFYSPSCGHCLNLIQNQLPPLLAEYGDQLKIVAINTALPNGQELYLATVSAYGILDDRLGVPTLVVKDIVMVGGEEIPSQFPGIVADELSNGGTDWPDIPGLAEVLTGVHFSSQPNGNPQLSGQESGVVDNTSLSMIDKFKLDPFANTIAVLILIVMFVSIISVIISFTRPINEKDFWPKWVIPIVSVLGIGVAFYLTYVETSGVEAVCGPVGDCNIVQLSPFAVLFGILPVGLLGLIGYALILAGWALYHYGPKNFQWAASIAVWGMAFFGVLFSVYLTFLEPFVIGATCMWCISSAIFQTIIFLAATAPAKRAWQEDDYENDDFEIDEEIETEVPDDENEVDVEIIDDTLSKGS